MEITTNKSGNLELSNTQQLIEERLTSNTPIGEHEYTMELYVDNQGVPTAIEWDIPALDECVGIGLWFEGKNLCDYDGVFELPKEAAKLIRKSGYTVGNDFI